MMVASCKNVINVLIAINIYSMCVTMNCIASIVDSTLIGGRTMGRLIDADALKKHIEEVIKKQNGKNTDLVPVGELMVFIDREPTAYDPDKVVKQLEERTAFLKDCTKYGNKTAEQQSKSYDTMMMYEVKDLVDDLLDIVKAGGTDDN